MSVADKLDLAKQSFLGSSVAKTVCKATNREIMGPKKKHIGYLISCTMNERMDLSYMFERFLERLRLSSWVIVSKTLISIHSLLSNGDERFIRVLSARSSLWDLDDFSDKTAFAGYDMNLFIKRYSNYLTYKVELYRMIDYDFCRINRGADGLLRRFDEYKLLKAMADVQTLLDSLLEIDLQSSDFSNGVINSAFVLLFKDLIKLFACYNDGLINLLERYYDMRKENCKATLDVYKKFLSRTNIVKNFLKVAKDIGINENVIPDLVEAPNSLLDELQNHYKSLEKGEATNIKQINHGNLAPITISEWSEQFDFQEDDATSPVSPDDSPADQIKSETILLGHAPEYASKGNPNWETLFESDKPSELSKASKNNEDDLLQLQQVFQSQIPLPTAGAFSVNSHFGTTPYNHVKPNQPTVTLNPSTNPFDCVPGPLNSANIQQPLNLSQKSAYSAVHQPYPAVHQPYQNSTGDLHSSLANVVKSLDNFDVNGSSSGQTAHQWSVPRAKVKTGGDNFQMKAVANTTLPLGNSVRPNLPYSQSEVARSCESQTTLLYNRPLYTSGFSPMPYGPTSTIVKPPNAFTAQRRSLNPFDAPPTHNQALF